MKPSRLDFCRHWGPVAGIILFSLALQVVFLFRVLDNPHTLFWVDAQHYHAIATRLYENGTYSDPTSEWNIYRSPGFPFLLSLMMHVVGTSVLHLRLVLILMTVPFLLVLYRLGLVLGNRRTGLLAAALGAIYPLYLYTPLTLYPESVLVPLFAAIGLLLYHAGRERRPGLLLLLGAAIALAVLVRPTSIVWIPVALFHLFWGRRPQLKHFATATACVVLIPAVCVAAWMYRNYRVHGCAVFATGGSMNLLESYSEYAGGSKRDTVVDPAFDAQLDQAATAAEREKLRMDKVKAFMRNHPGRTLKVAVTHCLDLWNPIPSTAVQGGTAQSRYKAVNAVAYVPILLLALGGFIICRKNLLVRSFLLLTVLNTLANGIVSVSVRYRLVTDFVLILMAACALTALAGRYALLIRALAHRRRRGARYALAHAWQRHETA